MSSSKIQVSLLTLTPLIVPIPQPYQYSPSLSIRISCEVVYVHFGGKRPLERADILRGHKGKIRRKEVGIREGNILCIIK